MKIKDKYKVEIIPKKQTYEWLLYKHYIGRIPSISYSFGLFDKENQMVGVCVYGIPASHELLRCCGDEYKDKAYELSRLVKNDNLEKNVQSFFVAQTFKFFEKPTIIISYADKNQNHHGYTYQSLNFYYTGEGGSPVEYIFNGNQVTSRHMNKSWFLKNNFKFDGSLTFKENFINLGGKVVVNKYKKFRYIYFIGTKKQKKNMLKKLKYKIYPYPKGENKKYDSNYKPSIQQKLF
tara:strand:- start:202 stop:906 length:705 start_codon:yes stop_codon:yes gene_type:complete